MILSIDATKWKLRQYTQFIKATKEADLDKIIELVPMLITKWDLKGDPQDADYLLDNVDLKQWIDITKAVNEALTAEFASPKA